MTPEEMLKALAEEDRELEAPLFVETKLKAAFRQRHAPSILVPLRNFLAPLRNGVGGSASIGAFLGLGIAAIITIAVIEPRAHDNLFHVLMSSLGKQESVSLPSRDSVIATVRPQEAVSLLKTEPATATARPVAHRRAVQPREIVTDFFPLVDDASPAADGAELVRVNLPASAMRDVGLPVREDRMNDRVQADVLMNYGMATAVRFVSYQK